MTHKDSKGNTYYEITMNSVSGCSKIKIEEFFFYLGKARYLFALFGVILGQASQMAGRLFLKYFVFGCIIV